MLFINKTDSDSVFAKNKDLALIEIGTYINTEHEFACDVVYDATPYGEIDNKKENAAPLVCWFLQWGNGDNSDDYFIWVSSRSATFLGERRVCLRAHVPVTVDMVIEWAMQQPAFKSIPDELRAYAYAGQ